MELQLECGVEIDFHDITIDVDTDRILIEQMVFRALKYGLGFTELERQEQIRILRSAITDFEVELNEDRERLITEFVEWDDKRLNNVMNSIKSLLADDDGLFVEVAEQLDDQLELKSSRAWSRPVFGEEDSRHRSHDRFRNSGKWRNRGYNGGTKKRSTGGNWETGAADDSDEDETEKDQQEKAKQPA